MGKRPRTVSTQGSRQVCLDWCPKPSNLKQSISSKTKGPGEQGAAGCCPKILPLKRAKRVSVPSIGVIGKSALENGQFPRRNFWMISWGPFLSRPLFLLLEAFRGFKLLPNYPGCSWKCSREPLQRAQHNPFPGGGDSTRTEELQDANYLILCFGLKVATEKYSEFSPKI